MKSLLIASLAAAGAIAAASRDLQAQESVEREAKVVVTGVRPAEAERGVTLLTETPEQASDLEGWKVLDQSVANLHVSEGGGGGYGSLFSLRGLANTPYFSAPAVTVYLGDIPLPSSFAYPGGFFGFDTVEVLRGPQGTLLGRATDGGAILITPPGAGGSDAGTFVARLGSQGLRSGSASVQTSGEARVDASVDVSAEARDGVITNTLLGRKVDDQEDESGFARLRFRPEPGDEWTAEVLASRTRAGAQPLVPLGGPLFSVTRAQEGVTDLDSMGAALKGSFERPWGRLSSVTSYTDWRMNPYSNYLVLPPALASSVLQEQRSWNEELHGSTPDSGVFRVESGLWLSRVSTHNAIARSLYGIIPIENSGFAEASDSAAVFGRVAYVPSERLRLNAGVRIEDNQTVFDRSESVPVAGLFYRGTMVERDVLPEVSVDLMTAADSKVQAAIAEGARPGGFASYTDNPALMGFAAEKLTSFTIGWDKADAAHHLELVLRGFLDRISNYQIERSFSASDYFVATAPRATSLGAEAELTWHPAPDWKVSANLGLTRAQLDRFTAPFTGADESGHQAPGVPTHTFGIEGRYGAQSGWWASVSAAGVGRTAYDEVSTPAYVQGSYVVFGARLGYAFPRWSLTVYGDNLGDKGYYQVIIPGVKSASPGLPRAYGLQVTRKF